MDEQTLLKTPLKTWPGEREVQAVRWSYNPLPASRTGGTLHGSIQWIMAPCTLSGLPFTLPAVYLPPIQVGNSSWLSVWETDEVSRQCQLFQRNGLKGEKTEQSHGLTGCSFTGLEVRCQSSVCEGESREGLSTGVPECEVTLCME